MDFLVLFLFYLAFLLICVVLICIFTKSQRLKAVVLGGAQVCSRVIPQCLQRAVQTLLHQLFHTRYLWLRVRTGPHLAWVINCCCSIACGSTSWFPAQGRMLEVWRVLGLESLLMDQLPLAYGLLGHPTFIVLHLLLQGLVYAEYTCEVFGYCRELEFSLPYLLLPYVLLSVNLVFFTLTCAANPGTITKANESFLLQVYKFDDVMFPKNSRCPTCDLRKPARSKHCRLCDRCVHRFDHHCVWVNNCIGAWNTRYFLIYLLTLTASAATIATVTAAFLLRLVTVSDLYQETYLDDVGHFQAVDTVFLIQHLFLAFPRIVFLLGFVIVLSMLLAGYLCFALYLAATNQTTNEWYKGDWAWCQRWPLVAWSPSAEPRIHQNIHSHGFRSNLREIFLPATPSYKKKEK